MIVPCILVVDDSRVTREVTKVFLVGQDVKLLDAVDGEDALRVVRAERPSVVVADMQMPKLDGPGLCRQLRADPALAEIPVVILTGNREKAAHQECLDAGAREVLLKPVQPAVLLASIQRCLAPL